MYINNVSFFPKKPEINSDNNIGVSGYNNNLQLPKSSDVYSNSRELFNTNDFSDELYKSTYHDDNEKSKVEKNKESHTKNISIGIYLVIGKYNYQPRINDCNNILLHMTENELYYEKNIFIECLDQDSMSDITVIFELGIKISKRCVERLIKITNRRFRILIPLNSNEYDIPNNIQEIGNTFENLEISITKGIFPFCDINDKMMKWNVNPKKYITIKYSLNDIASYFY